MPWRSILRYILNILFISSAFVTIYVFVKDRDIVTTFEGAVAVATLATLLMAGAVLLIWQEYRFSRKARYAEAIENQLDFVRAVPRQLANGDHCMRVMDKALTEVAQAFTLVTGTRVHSCIKRLTYESWHDKRPKVDDICRDPKSAKRGQFLERAAGPDGKPIVHWLDANTAFLSIVTGKGPKSEQYFFCNRLAAYRGYRNTSFQAYGYPPEETRFWHRPEHGWKLPYNSTVVVPVLSEAADIGAEGNSRPEVIGFLCIDSPGRSVFSSRYDVPLLKAFAHSLSPVLDAYMEFELQSRTARPERPSNW